MDLFKGLSNRRRGAAVEFLERLEAKTKILGACKIEPLDPGKTVTLSMLRKWMEERDIEVNPQSDGIVLAVVVPTPAEEVIS